MTTEQFIINTSDQILDTLLEYRKENPGFLFWLRAKDFSGKTQRDRLRKGYWFQGSSYIFVAFYRKGNSETKTKTFGFVVSGKNPNHPDVSIQWSFHEPDGEFPANERAFYERLTEIFPNAKRFRERGYRVALPSTNVLESLDNFLRNDKPKVDALLRELGLYEDFQVDRRVFEERLERVMKIRQEKIEGVTLDANSSEEETSEDGPHYWIIAPGENARKWKEFEEKGIIGIGWEGIGDLEEFESREEIQDALRQIYPERNSTPVHNSLALWEFSAVMKPGDIVIPKRGRSDYLGYGIVTGNYEFDEELPEYNHIRKVDWKKSGVWPDEVQRIVTKTLTDITKYPEYVDRLKRLIGIGQESIISKNLNYWWLNANPLHWRITDYEVGQEQSYTTFNEKGNKRRIYEYFHQIRPGDLILGYASSPMRQVIAVFEATRGVHIDEDTGNEEISFTIQKFLPDPVSIKTIEGLEAFKDSEITSTSRQGSLFKLTKEQYLAVLNDDVDKEEKIPEFTISDALKDLFMEEVQFQEILDMLRYKKNIVLQGPPGTGKTFMAKLIAYTFMGEKDPTKIEMIQFHQSYAYEDFIQGYRPTENGNFLLTQGVFYRFCKRAQSDPNKSYFFIIDEINRGNLSKIFGELMLLIEHDKRGESFSIALTYSDGFTKFHVPANVHLIGTMNTADRSLSIVDYALRRRFAFFDINPSFNSKFANHLILQGVPGALVNKISTRIRRLNETIEQKIGSGFQIGHSYFCNTQGPNLDDKWDKWFERIAKMEIEPLLREYWYDKSDQAEEEVKLLLNS